MKTHMQKFLLAIAIAASLLLTGGTQFMAPAMAADKPILLAQSFNDSKGLSNITTPGQNGVQTDKLGIYGPDSSGNTNLITIISNIVNSVFLLLGFVAVMLLIVEGILLIVSRGQEDRRKKVTATITNIAIGFAVILLSYAIVNQILAVLGANNIKDRSTGIEQLSNLNNEVGLSDVRNLTNTPLLLTSAGYIPVQKQLAIAQITPADLYKQFTYTFPQAADVSKQISADYRSVDYEFLAGTTRLPALRDQVLRINKADWDQMKTGTFGLFVPGNDSLTGAKAWVKPQYTYAVPADARDVTATAANSASGTAGQLIDLRGILDRVQEGVDTPNVIHVNIPGQSTMSMTVVVLKPGEENRFVFTGSNAFADYTSVDPATTSAWSDLESGPASGYDRRKSYFLVRNKSSNLDGRTYTSGSTVELNNGMATGDIEAEVTIQDQNTMPDTFQTIEHTITRGDGTLVNSTAKNGDKLSITVPIGENVYVVDDMTAILKDGKRVNLGTNTISLGNNSSPRYATLTSLGQLDASADYTDVSGAKTLRLMQGDMLSLTKSGQDPVKMKLTLKFYSKDAPNLIDIVSPGIKDTLVRFTDTQITQSGDPLNNVVPYTIAPELSFEQPGNYPVTIAIRDYTVGRTLATMQFNVAVVTDGTSLDISPSYTGTVGTVYHVRTFPAFASTSNLDSKRVEIVRTTSTGSGGETVVNRTLTGGQDDFDYVFDQDGEYTFRLYNKFKGAAQETMVSKSAVVMPQSPQVDFSLQPKASNPTQYELTDLSKYLDNGTVFVDVNPYDASITQTDWQTVGTQRVKTLTFTKPGTYRVTVTGRNKYGETSTKSSDVTVNTNVTYDIQLLDGQDNAFPQNQTPRFVVSQSFKTKVTGRNIAKIEVSYGTNQPLLTMSSGTQGSDGTTTFTGNMQLATQGQYTLNYTFYSVTKPTEKALTITRNILIRRPLEPLADFSVSEDGAVLNATPGLCNVGGVAKEGFSVKKNKDYLFDGSASLSSSDLPVNRDSATTGFRWNMGAQELASKTVSVRQSFTTQSTDANSCVPVTFTILENSNGQAKTSQMTRYFKVENSLPTYSSFVVEWPSGPLTTPVSVRAKLLGLKDPDEPNQNIQVLWFYEIQGNQLFNEVSYDSERLIRIDNYGAAGSQNIVRIGAQIYDMNTKETVKVYSDQRSITTGTTPALQSSIVDPQLKQGITYVPWVKNSGSLPVRLAATLSNGAAITDATVAWTQQRYATFDGCPSVPESAAATLPSTQLSASASFPLCGLYRISALIKSSGQQSQQTVSVKVYDSDSQISDAERPTYLALSNLRGSAGGATAIYEPSKENNASPFFPTGSGSQMLTATATYTQALSPTVARQAIVNGSYGTGTQLTASYGSISDMLNSYNLPPEVINDRLAQDNPAIASQVQQLRSSGSSDAQIQTLLAKNLAGSAINYNPNQPYNVPFGVAYDVYAEFGLRPATALNKVSSDDPAVAKRIADLRSSGASDASIVQTLRNDQSLTVQANLHKAADVPPTDAVQLLVSQGLTNKEIVDKVILDNPNLASQRDDFLASTTTSELLGKIEKAVGGSQNLQFQALSPLRMSLARAYLIMRERAYTDKLIVDKFQADDPDLAASITDMEGKGMAPADILRQLLTEPGKEVNIRIAAAIRSDFATIFATLKRHGLATETIYQKMSQDDDVFRVVYEAAQKKSTDISGYYQQFVQEPTLASLNYKPESMFVLPLRLAYAEYIAMGLTPTQVFDRLAKDNPNFGTDYETLKRQKSGGIEIFDSLVHNGAARNVRFSYMRPVDLPVDSIPAFFAAQGIPESLALQKVVQDNPQLSDWYAKLAPGSANFDTLIAAFPRDTFSISLFTGWDTTAGMLADSMTHQVSPGFALTVLGAADADLSRLITALRSQNKSDGEMYATLVQPNLDRKVRLYPYMGATLPLQDAARQLSSSYAVSSAVLGHIARFDDAFGDFYMQAVRRLYSPASTLANVGDRTVYVAAFRPVLASPEEFINAIQLSGISLAQGFGLYKETFPELAEMLDKHKDSPADLANDLRTLYPVSQSIPLTLLSGEAGQSLVRNSLGLTADSFSLDTYLGWLRGWGISSDVGLAQLAASDETIAAALAGATGKSIDEKVAVIRQLGTNVSPNLTKRFALPFVDAYRLYERRGLSTGMIYSYLGAQDPVFMSLYNQQRLERVPQSKMFDAFQQNPATATVLTNPLMPADISTLYLARTFEAQQIPDTVIASKILTDQSLLGQQTKALDAILTLVARDSLLQTTAFSLTRPVTLDQNQKQLLLKAYGMSDSTAAQLVANTGSGLTIPPQIVVDIPTYVAQAQEQGIGTQQLLEDVMRLVPDQAPALRQLLAQNPAGDQLAQSIAGILPSNSTLPLFTRVQASAADDSIVSYGADVNGTLQELSGYIPGTLPVSFGSGETLDGSSDDTASRLLAGIRQVVLLPAGVDAYSNNSRLVDGQDAFRFQNLEMLKGENIQPNSEALSQLVSQLSSSGTLLRGSAPETASTQATNIFGLVGETTLLDCSQFSVVVNEAGDETLVCTANTLYEQSLETFRAVILRLLGEAMPEEMSTLMASFERANSLEDRLEAMNRLRDRVTRLPVTEDQRTELLRRLAFVRVFDLDDTLAQQLAKRGADDLMTKLEDILDVAGTSMVTERGTLAKNFADISQQNEVGNVLLVRYSLAVGDLLRSQSVDPAVKDMVLDSMRQTITNFVQDVSGQSGQLAGTAQQALTAKLQEISRAMQTKVYTYAWATTTIAQLRALTDLPTLPEAGKADLDARLATLAKQLGVASADVMSKGIPAVAANRSDTANTVQSLLLESSIWERQRRGLLQFMQVLSADQRYNTQQKQDVLNQLFNARHTYLVAVRDMVSGADFSESARAALLKDVDTALATTNLSAMVQAEAPLWQYLENDASSSATTKYTELWQKAADFQLQLYRATNNVLGTDQQSTVAPFFDPADLSEDRQKALLEALGQHLVSVSPDTSDQLRATFVQEAAADGSTLAALVKNFASQAAAIPSQGTELTRDQQILGKLQELRAAVLITPALTDADKIRFFAAYDRYIRQLAQAGGRALSQTGADLLADLRDSIHGRLSALVTSNPGMRQSAHVVQDLKKVVLAHPSLPLQYKLEMLFELQHGFPFYPFATAFTQCTAVYVKDTADTVRRICLEEKNQQADVLPVDKEQLFALMQSAAAKKPTIGTGSLMSALDSTLHALTTDKTLSVDARRQYISSMAQAFEWPDVSYTDRNSALAYVYSIPVISDEMLQLQETSLSLESYYISLGELESRLRAIMLGVNELPDTLKGTVREALMQVKKYYSTDTQRSNVMLSLASNVIRGSELSEARKDMLVRVLDTLGDTLQPVPVDRLTPEVSLEQMDAILANLTTVPTAQSLVAGREDVVRLLGQNDVLGSIGALDRLSQEAQTVQGLSDQERADFGFYTVVARDFLSYVQSQGPRVADAVVEQPSQPTQTIDPVTTVQQPAQPANQEPSLFWTLLWGLVYIIATLLLLVLCLGVVLYVLFLSYKRTHPDIHVDFEEYILILRGQLATFFKRFSRDTKEQIEANRIPDEPLPQKPEETDEQPVEEASAAPAASAEPAPVEPAATPAAAEAPVAPAQEQKAAPAWLQLGDTAAQSQPPVNAPQPPQDVQTPPADVQSSEPPHGAQ